MKILITGSSGFVGKAVCRQLKASGHDLIPLKRDLSNFEGAQALIHLGGEPIANGRWTSKKKRRILESRAGVLKRLAATIHSLENSKPAIVISASAVGYYGDRGDEILDEESSPGTGFLAEVCQQWEQPIATRMLGPGRQVALRMGVVLGRGGALEKMLPIFQAGLGGPLGSGKQWMSWIHIDDFVTMIEFVLNSPEISGVINAVAPQQITNEQFSKALAEVLGTRSLFRTPAVVLRALLGERAQLLLSSQRVVPSRMLKLGFKYQHPGIQNALQEFSSKSVR